MHGTDKVYGYWEEGIFRKYGSISSDPLEWNNSRCLNVDKMVVIPEW